MMPTRRRIHLDSDPHQGPVWIDQDGGRWWRVLADRSIPCQLCRRVYNKGWDSTDGRHWCGRHFVRVQAPAAEAGQEG